VTVTKLPQFAYKKPGIPNILTIMSHIAHIEQSSRWAKYFYTKTVQCKWTFSTL